MEIKFVTLLLILSLMGCTAHVEHLPKAERSRSPFPDLPEKNEVLVGVALSGGGSRAAIFGAGGLESLAKRKGKGGRHSLLEKITHISSVSGGSIAASYFAMEKPNHTVPVLTPGGVLTKKYRMFFNRFTDTVAENFQDSMEQRQFSKFRWGNPALRAKSLEEVLDESFLDNLTLNDLYRREAKGDTPRLLLNSTLYNNGRRFVITTLPQEAFDYDFVKKVRVEFNAMFKNRRAFSPFPADVEKAQTQFIPLTLSAQEINADGRRLSLSRAVAASSAFPFVIGPITTQVAGSSDFLHAGDGGLVDRQGIETLVQVALKKLEEGEVKRALIIAFDSSYPFWAGNSWLNQTDKGFSVYLKDPARIVDIMEQRATMYQTMLFHILQTEGIVLPNPDTFKLIVLRHTDAKWKKDLSDLPQVCKEKKSHWTPETITGYLAEIPTRLKVQSQCDKELLLVAASKVVNDRQNEIISFLEN